MDGDPAVEPQLDSFSLTFPLPYRVAFIVVLLVVPRRSLVPVAGLVRCVISLPG